MVEPLVPQPRELTVEEARVLFDEHARAEVGMSGPEFLRRWDADELDPDDDAVLGVAMLIPFGR
ncbi:MAG: hypothetical protein ACRD0K_26515 [Egibacteraceae bacterium]